MMKAVNYLREVRTELAKVSWPSRQDSLRMTGIVIVASLAVGLYIGGLDYLFTNLLGYFFR